MEEEQMRKDECQPEKLVICTNNNCQTAIQIQSASNLKSQNQDDNIQKSDQEKKSIISFGQKIFLSNFLSGSVIVLYVTIFYAVLLSNLQKDCDNTFYLVLVVLFSVSDLLMIFQHLASFYALIYRSNISLSICLYQLLLSILIKLVSISLFLERVVSKQLCSNVHWAYIILPISMLVMGLVYLVAYYYLKSRWNIVLARKWKKRFMLIRKKLEEKKRGLSS